MTDPVVLTNAGTLAVTTSPDSKNSTIDSGEVVKLYGLYIQLGVLEMKG